MGQKTVAPAYSITGLEVAKLESKDFHNLPEAPYRRKMPVTTSNIITTQELDKSPYFSDVYIPHTKTITPVEEVPSVRRREEQAAPAAPSPPPVEGFEQREWEPTSRLSLLSEAAVWRREREGRRRGDRLWALNQSQLSEHYDCPSEPVWVRRTKKKADQTVGASD